MNIVLIGRVLAVISGFLATAIRVAAGGKFEEAQRERFPVLKRLQGRDVQFFVLTLVFLTISMVAQVTTALSDSTVHRLDSETGQVSARVSGKDLEDELRLRKAPGSTEAQDYFAAGIRDFRASRFSDAVQNFERSVRAARTVVGYWTLAAAQTTLSHFADAEQALVTATELFTPNTPREIAASVLTSLANVQEEQGGLDKAEDHLKKALARLSSPAESIALAEIHNGLGRIYLDRGDVDRSLVEHSTALKIYERLKDVPGQAAALNNIGNVYVVKGPLDEAVSYHERALDLYRSVGDDAGRLRALNNIANALADSGEYSEARNRYDESLALARSMKNRQAEARALNNIAELMRQSQSGERQLRDALMLAEQALGLATEHGFDDVAADALITTGNLYTNLGDFPQAEQCFASAVPRYERLKDKNGVALATGNFAEILRIEGKYEESIAASNRALTIYAETKNVKGLANTLISIGNVHVLRREWPQAEASYTEALQIARQNDNEERIGRALAGLGEVYLDTNKLVESIANTEGAIRIFHDLPSPQDEAGALVNLADAHEKHHEYAAASDELSQARAMYKNLPVPPDVEKPMADIDERLRTHFRKK